MAATQPLEVFYDGECPLCAREMALLRRLDRGRGRLQMVDLTAPDFDPASTGRTREELMDRIHGRLPDGRVIEGMEVFRRAYAAVGWGWLLAPTAWPGVRALADRAYRWFARNRLRITGRGRACPDGSCAAHRGAPRPLPEGAGDSAGASAPRHRAGSARPPAPREAGSTRGPAARPPRA